MAEGMVREGILGMTSIGFIPKKDHAVTVGEETIKVFDEIELLEISLVPVPANPEAQALVRSMFGYLEKDAPAELGVHVRHSEAGSWAWQEDMGWSFRAPIQERRIEDLLPKIPKLGEPPPDGADIGSAGDIVGGAIREWIDEQRALRG